MNIEKIVEEMDKIKIIKAGKIQLEKKEKLYLLHVKTYNNNFEIKFVTSKKEEFIKFLKEITGEKNGF